MYALNPLRRRSPATDVLHAALVAAWTSAAACSASEPATSEPVAPSAAQAPIEKPSPWQLSYDALDEATARELEPLLRAGALEVTRFFGAPFPESFEIVIHPDRAAFDASLPPEWGIGKTECWMVATGIADIVQLLSPRVWKSEACEHDAADAHHVQDLLAHELVHVYHGQRGPSRDFMAVTGIDWFVEGLATYASGQLEADEIAPAREALEEGRGPAQLGQAWSGKYRYGVSGSLVAFLDHELGRERLIEMLSATSPEELLELIGMSEEELLERWRDWVRSGA